VSSLRLSQVLSSAAASRCRLLLLLTRADIDDDAEAQMSRSDENLSSPAATRLQAPTSRRNCCVCVQTRQLQLEMHKTTNFINFGDVLLHENVYTFAETNRNPTIKYIM